MVRKLFVWLLSCIVVVSVGFVLMMKVIDFNEYKPQFQKALKEATGYDIGIRGDIVMTFSPFGVSLSNVVIANPSYKANPTIATIESVDVAIDFLPLLKKEFRIKSIEVDSLALTIEKSKENQLNYVLTVPLKDPTKKPTPPSAKSDTNNSNKVNVDKASLFSHIREIRLNDAVITYQDNNASTKLVLDNTDIIANDIHVEFANNQLQTFSFSAHTDIDKLVYNTYTMNDISMNFSMKDLIIMADMLKFTFLETPMQGSGKFDFSGKQPKIALKQKFDALKLAVWAKQLGQYDGINGLVSGEVKLSFFLADALSFRSTLNGNVRLLGKEISIKGFNIDKMVELFNGNPLKNLGALVSGADVQQEANISQIHEASVIADIGYSEMNLVDVAFSTIKNRIALKGKINIVDERLMDVKAALLNENGCSLFEQKINGTFSNPQLKIDEHGMIVLTNVAFSLFKKSSKETSSESKCVPFYEGVIKHPSQIEHTNNKDLNVE